MVLRLKVFCKKPRSARPRRLSRKRVEYVIPSPVNRLGSFLCNPLSRRNCSKDLPSCGISVTLPFLDIFSIFLFLSRKDMACFLCTKKVFGEPERPIEII